ncbi:MAG: hypothetical protein U0132_12225 [Gemmatimonadaceae bacterium]
MLTNNPMKLVGLKGYGLEIAEQVRIAAPSTDENAGYLGQRTRWGTCSRPDGRIRRTPDGTGRRFGVVVCRFNEQIRTRHCGNPELSMP